jgi:hypothetical protein
MNMSEFATKHGITLSYSLSNPPIIDGKTPFKYKVTLHYNGKAYTTQFSKGAAHVCRMYAGRTTGKMVDYAEVQQYAQRVKYGEVNTFLRQYAPIPPDCIDVLVCLQSDCQCYLDSPTWLAFATSFGYNPDNISAKRSYKACRQAAQELTLFFGRAVFDEFLACSEE